MAPVDGFTLSPDSKREKQQFMVLQAFFDDSESEPQSPYYVVAGFASSVENWSAFATEWQAILDQPPALKRLKMSEAANMQGEFRKDGWTVELRDERVSQLLRLMRPVREGA